MPTTDISPSQPAVVDVVVSTYNGSRYVGPQLESLLGQLHDVAIHASDDVSTDDTVAKLNQYLRDGVDTIHANPNNVGFVKNFESGLQRVVESNTQYVALSDQDDIWDEQRIQVGMQRMSELENQFGKDTPLLVHSDLCMISADGQQSYASFLGYRRYRISSQRSLNIILGENGVMGNTILMNRALAELCLPFPDNLHVHDYWIALLAELFGHRAMLKEPLVNYRLHESNASNTAHSMSRGPLAVIANAHWKKLLRRDFKLPFKEDTRLESLQYLMANTGNYPELTSQQQESIRQFIEYLKFNQPRWRSARYLLSSGIARTGIRYRLRLMAAVMLTTRYPR